MVTTSSDFMKDLFRGLSDHFGDNYNSYPEEYRDLFDVQSSSQRYEEYVQRTGFGLAPQKPEGQSIQFDSAQEGYTSRINNLAFALGSTVTHEAIEDNLYIQMGESQTRWMARSMVQTKENFSANVYNRAFNSSYTGGDGVELISNAHLSRAGNWSNRPTNYADLSEASLEDMAIQIMESTDDRGLRIQLKAKCLLVPVEEIFNAERILKSALRPDTANNDLNALKSMSVIPKVAVNHYFTDADAWFIRTDIPSGEGLIFQQREAVSFDSDGEFTSKNAQYSAYERYGAGWNDPRALFGSQGI